MTDVQELIAAVQAAGVSITTRAGNLVISPASKMPTDLKSQLREHKVEILRRLELESMRRLEAAGITVAVWPDGSMKILITEEDTVSAIDTNGVIYSPADMYH